MQALRKARILVDDKWVIQHLYKMAEGQYVWENKWAISACEAGDSIKDALEQLHTRHADGWAWEHEPQLWIEDWNYWEADPRKWV